MKYWVAFHYYKGVPERITHTHTFFAHVFTHPRSGATSIDDLLIGKILTCCRALNWRDRGCSCLCVCSFFLFVKLLGFSHRVSTLVIWSYSQSSIYRDKVGLSIHPFNTLNMHLWEVNCFLSRTSHCGVWKAGFWWLSITSRKFLILNKVFSFCIDSFSLYDWFWLVLLK